MVVELVAVVVVVIDVMLVIVVVLVDEVVKVVVMHESQSTGQSNFNWNPKIVSEHCRTSNPSHSCGSMLPLQLAVVVVVVTVAVVVEVDSTHESHNTGHFN